EAAPRITRPTRAGREPERRARVRPRVYGGERVTVIRAPTVAILLQQGDGPLVELPLVFRVAPGLTARIHEPIDTKPYEIGAAVSVACVARCAREPEGARAVAPHAVVDDVEPAELRASEGVSTLAGLPQVGPSLRRVGGHAAPVLVHEADARAAGDVVHPAAPNAVGLVIGLAPRLTDDGALGDDR